MRRSMGPFFAGLATMALLQSGVAFGVIPAPFRALFQSADTQVTRIETLASQVRDPSVRAGLFDASQHLKSDLGNLRALTDQPVGPRLAPVASDAEFHTLLAAVHSATFSDAALGVVRDATSMGDRRFTCAQVVAILDEITFANAKVEAGVLFYPLIADPARWFTVPASLTFSSDQDKLRALTSGS